MPIPTWALVAIIGHLANGTAFIIDKSLLTTSFKRSATYAGTVGLLGILAAILIPFGTHLPGVIGWVWIVLSGATFVLALWSFFSALSSGEASRVVPIIGSLIPIFTLIGTWAFLDERLNATQLMGFGALIVATMILAGGASSHRLPKRALSIAILSAILFAISSVTVKLAYDAEGFLTTFSYSRIIGFLVAISILGFDTLARTELVNSFHPSASASKKTGIAKYAFLLILLGQGIGSTGFVLVQYAISLGSASLVNALQAVQYAFLVLVAFLFAKRAPQLLGEDLTPKAIIRKSIALCFVALGLWFVV